MNETRTLAEYLSNLRYGDVPAEIIQEAKLSVLDAIGVGLIASRRPWSQITAAVAQESGGGDFSSVWGHPFKTSPQQAALANSTAVHGIEMDDRRPFVRVHAGCIAIPSTFAVAEKVGASGRDYLTSVVSAYELGYRVGHAVRVMPGIHAAGHIGVWVGVGGAANGLSLDARQFTNAMGLAGSMATSALAEFTQDPEGTMVKRLHMGLSSHHGVLAALLAQKGFTGPATVLEGMNGYGNIFTPDKSDLHFEALTDRLGSYFSIVEREIKAYSAWGGSHTVIETAGQLMAEHGIKPGDIEWIRVGGSNYLVDEHESTRPRSIMAAQYSLPFITAAALCKGDAALVDPDGFWTEDVLDDQEILRTVDKMTLFVDPELDQKYLTDRIPGATRLVMGLKDGTEFDETRYYVKGTLENPMTADEIETKFRNLTRRVISDDHAQRIIDTVRDLDALPDVRALGDLVRLPARVD